MPQSIPPGLKREHVLQALADLDAGLDHPFGQPTGYELVYEGRRYAPKAVVGVAIRAVLGRMLLPGEFSGGEAPGQANFVLRKLGFTVVNKGEQIQEEESQEAKDWSADEVRLVVADYFSMLEQELLGKAYNKSQHRKALIPQLNGRSDGSVEFKHQNISAVLAGEGLPYVEGYKPRGNYQALLAQEIDEYLDRNPNFLEQLAAAPTVNPDKPSVDEQLDPDAYFVERPEAVGAPQSPEKPWLSRRGRRVDFASRDAANRRLGKLGEEFTVWLERRRLRARGRDDLAEQVEWIAETLGDGLGYDVRSFDDVDGSERLVEVKTTALPKHTPFYVTGNEVRCSEDRAEQFQLFRVFDYGRATRIYILHGALTANCHLEPMLYRATI